MKDQIPQCGVPEINLESARFHKDPYPHFVAQDIASQGVSEEILRWFENGAMWEAVGSAESARYVVSMNTRTLPGPLHFLVSEHFLDKLCNQMEAVFGVRLSRRVDVSGLRLGPTYKIGVHTDYGSRDQTHRLLISLTRRWEPTCGGELLLLSKKQNETRYSVAKVLPPTHGRALGFEISQRSFHSVQEVAEGDRFTLCFYFFGRAAG